MRKVFRNNFGADLSHLQFIGQNLMNGGVIQFKSSPIILTVKRRSERTRSRTLTTFSAGFETEGLLLRDSSSIDSLPSENALNHRKTWVLDKTLSP
ncbi:uncharacterized protein TNCV_2649991 [Trichonephila clavipes]|nr:uncharacterized protein TNCV_2649991 [Trichonephila clavipes]